MVAGEERRRSEMKRGMLWVTRRCVVEFCEGVWDVIRHVDINATIGVVPVDGETTVVATSPVGGDGILG